MTNDAARPSPTMQIREALLRGVLVEYGRGFDLDELPELYYRFDFASG